MKDVKKRLYFAGLRVFKDITQKFHTRVKEPSILFITGCQRSGTTLMYEIFQKDYKARVYPEFSRLSDPADHEKLRMLPPDQVKRIFNNSRCGLIISKPLVESQNIDKLLNYFRGSKALWMFREYKSVAKSNIKHFGKDNGVKDLTPIIEKEINNWRSERVSEDVFRVIKNYYFKDMNPYDAAALFWYARNSLFFELRLNERPDVMLFSYEKLVEKPETMIRRVYDFIGKDFPGQRIIKDIHSEAVGRGKSVDLNPEIDLICSNLYSRLKAEQIRQETILNDNIKYKSLQSSDYQPR